MKIKSTCIAAMAGTLVLAGCGSAGHGAAAAPQPSITVTHTVTARPTRSASLPSPSPTVAKTATVTPAQPASPAGIQAVTPWSVVSECYGDIESGDYADAYALLSSGSVTGQSYQQFVDGFACTTVEDLADVGTIGDTVTASLQALQCDGTVNQYQGTYSVQNGLLASADITQTG
jgi:hypothetical protein